MIIIIIGEDRLGVFEIKMWSKNKFKKIKQVRQ